MDPDKLKEKIPSFADLDYKGQVSQSFSIYPYDIQII